MRQAYHLEIKGEYFNFGKEIVDKHTPALRTIIDAKKGVIIDENAYPNNVVIAIYKKNAPALKKAIQERYYMTDVTDYLNADGKKLLKEADLKK